MADSTESASTKAPSCVDCGAPTALAVVDCAAIDLSWLCGRCIAMRYGPHLGAHRHLEEGAACMHPCERYGSTLDYCSAHGCQA
jgi:hypothetical protein